MCLYSDTDALRLTVTNLMPQVGKRAYMHASYETRHPNAHLALTTLMAFPLHRLLKRLARLQASQLLLLKVSDSQC